MGHHRVGQNRGIHLTNLPPEYYVFTLGCILNHQKLNPKPTIIFIDNLIVFIFYRLPNVETNFLLIVKTKHYTYVLSSPTFLQTNNNQTYHYPLPTCPIYCMNACPPTTFQPWVTTEKPCEPQTYIAI